MIKLGSKVKDSVTGFEGVAIARCEYLFGCISVQVQPEGMTEDGKMKPALWVDEQRLDVLSKAIAGGYHDSPPNSMHP